MFLLTTRLLVGISTDYLHRLSVLEKLAHCQPGDQLHFDVFLLTSDIS